MRGTFGQRCPWSLGVMALGMIIGTAEAKSVYAATIVVNTTTSDAITDGRCSLPEAVANANANVDTTGGDCVAGTPGTDTIDLSSLSGTITLSTGVPAIFDAVTISGPGASTLTIDANGMANVFVVFAPATITGVTLTGASHSAIFNIATLTVQNSAISANGGGGSDGAGIENLGTLTIMSSTISDICVLPANSSRSGTTTAPRGMAT